MTQTPASAQADLAFLRTLVEGDPSRQAAFAGSYCFAGVAYGVQILLQWLGFAGVIALQGLPYLVVVTLPTLTIFGFLIWQSRRARRASPPTPASRAIDAMFQGVGLANLGAVGAIVAASIGQKAGVMILVYPAVLFAFQGACWFVVFRLRRRLWMLAVALAWTVSAIAMGFALGAFELNLYIAIAAFDMWVLMALPGAALLIAARKATP